MTYEEAKTFLNTKHIYKGVTPLEVVNCPVNKFLTEVDGVTYLGTETPYLAVEPKELKPVE